MKLSHPRADIFVPDASQSVESALARTTHLCIGAHQDDIEVMAYAGVADCFHQPDRWFTGVTVTDGAGSPRGGPYANLTDAELAEVRRREQNHAALIGDYSAQFQLGYPSAAVKDPDNPEVLRDLTAIVTQAAAEVVYLHQPADKHDTHVAVFGHSLRALRALPPEKRPRQVYGCEAWRSLDWLLDDDKLVMDAGRLPHLAAALVGVFDSQINGSKRYDLAAMGRRVANATLHQPRAKDQLLGASWAMDLTPLVHDPSLSIIAYTEAHIERLRADVNERLRRLTRG